MDDFVHKKLSEWGLSNFIERFRGKALMDYLANTTIQLLVSDRAHLELYH